MKLLKYFALLAAAFTLSTLTFAEDFELKKLPSAKEGVFDLTVGKPMSYYDYVHENIGQAMLELAGTRTRIRGNNEKVLLAGGGIRVKLGEKNYNVHINFPKGPQGGRSYGWTADASGGGGRIGDWSDKMFLNEIFKVTTSGDSEDIASFYALLINLLGSSDPTGIDELNWQSQRVAANFLAIYTAEQYRSMVPDPHHNWDDALFQTALLAAFHGGQKKVKLFYLGEFTDSTKKQAPGVYNRGRPGVNFESAPEKEAALFDYWQFSANPDSTSSGINITRSDFSKMGKMITYYMKKNDNALLSKIEHIVGESPNVIEAISEYFTDNKSILKDIPTLSKLVSEFMLEIHEHADAVTKFIDKAIDNGSCAKLLTTKLSPRKAS